MTSSHRLLHALVAVVALAWPAAAVAQTERPSPEQLEQMLEPLQPTTQHRELERLVGRWTQEITYQMGGPPMRATGTLVNRMGLGGRFLISEGTSNNPTGIGGSTVEVMSIYGFDRRTSEYTIVGFDTMGTYYVTAAGNREPDGLIRMRGETLEIEAGTREMRQYDMTMRVVDADTYVTEIIFRFTDRAPLTVVSITHRRQR